MTSIIICPAERPVSRVLAASVPLSNVPMLGWSLLEYRLSHLAGTGVKEVIVLASDRPEQVRELTGDGARWGMGVQVVPVPHEPTPAEALALCLATTTLEAAAVPGPPLESGPSGPSSAPGQLVVLDHFPGLPEQELFSSCREWFQALLAWMPRANPPDRIGAVEIQPGIRAGLHARISPKATLRPPCWLEEGVYIGPGAIVGPEVVLEQGAFVESRASVAHSVVGPATYVGREVDIRHGIAWGNTLVDWFSGTETTVADAFILCSLDRPFVAKRRERWLKRLAPRPPAIPAATPLDWASLSAQERSAGE